MVINAIGNGIPFPKGEGISSLIKKAMILWYDLKRQGATNETMKVNPILKDLSGNGHDASCYNFAWSGMSGIGSYATNFQPRSNEVDVTVLGTQKWRVNTIIHAEPVLSNTKTFTGWNKTVTIKIEGLTDNQNNELEMRVIGTKGLIHLHNGENVVNFGDAPVSKGWVTFTFNNKSLTNIIIEVLPEYPNALVADGVDDYAKVDGTPILTDYTVIAKRKILSEFDGIYRAFAAKGTTAYQGAFILERQNNKNKYEIYNFGHKTTFTEFPTDITYLTSNSYNGNFIAKGDGIDEDVVLIFSRFPHSQHISAVLYSFILFNRTLTTKEINWVKENLIEGDIKI